MDLRLTGNLARAFGFYSRVCGWRMERVDAGGPSYRVLDWEGGPREGPAGWRSVVAPPEGAELGFWQPKRAAPGAPAGN